MKRTKANTLTVYWSKREKDIVYGHPDGPQTRCDSRLLHNVMSQLRYSHPIMQTEASQSLFDELESRGYDLSTIRFSILKKAGHARWKEEGPK